MGRRRRSDEDIAAELDQLQKSGMSAKVIEHRRKLLGGGDITVWPENALTVQVFLSCLPTALPQLRPVGMTVVSGIWWLGISALELDAAMRLMGVPRKDRPAIAESVQVMSPVWARERNRQDEMPPPASGEPERAANERPRAV